ncbi:Glycerol dehydrogenase [compost metagenome]
MHGEKVAFTTLVQLALESAPLEEVERVLAFCRTVGLPVALSELHLSEDQPERLRLAAEASCEADSPMANMPFSVTAEDVLRAMLQANSWGMKLTSFPG